ADPIVCRICRDESTPEEPLYTPCKCTGSIRHVHQACLSEWLSHSGKEKCEVCGARFQFKVVYAEDMPTFLPITVVVRNAIRGTAETVANAIRVLVVSEVWIVGLPLVFGMMWGKLF
ncbi:RING-variant domain-domain-containing protein, partial [Catenaria anguillulae PL171]